MEKKRKLIDVDELKKWLKSPVGFRTNCEDCFSTDCLNCIIEEAIENAPTVDAVEVVRCEDCLYRSQYPDESGHYKCGGLLTEDEELLLMVKPDFFCAYGERRGKDAVD